MSDRITHSPQSPALLSQVRRSHRWLIAALLCLAILACVWRLLFFELWSSDEFKPPPSWNGKPAFIETAMIQIDPPPDATLQTRFRIAIEKFYYRNSITRRTHTFPARTNMLYSVPALLTTCMQVTGTRYLIAREVAYVEFGHSNVLTGTQWVATVEGVLQSAETQCMHPATNAPWVERLLFVREKSGVVKVLPPSRLGDYQKVGLVDPAYKAEAVATGQPAH